MGAQTEERKQYYMQKYSEDACEPTCKSCDYHKHIHRVVWVSNVSHVIVTWKSCNYHMWITWLSHVLVSVCSTPLPLFPAVNEPEHFHYQIHYCSDMTVASYLIRMEPYTQYFIHLQVWRLLCLHSCMFLIQYPVKLNMCMLYFIYNS